MNLIYFLLNSDIKAKKTKKKQFKWMLTQLNIAAVFPRQHILHACLETDRSININKVSCM